MKKYSLKLRNLRMKKSKKRSTKRNKKTSPKYHKKKYDGMQNNDDDPIQPPPGGVAAMNFIDFVWQEVSYDIILDTFSDLTNTSEIYNKIKIIDQNNIESVTIHNSFFMDSDDKFNSIYKSITVFDEENNYDFYINIVYADNSRFTHPFRLIRHFKNGNIHYFKMIPDNDFTPPGGV